MSELSGKTVIQTTKREAPALMVRFRCEVCGGEGTVNVYRGVPMCAKCPGTPVMTPLRFVDFNG